MDKQISRRKFLKTGCLTAGAIGFTLCGGGALAASYRPSVDTPSIILGENGKKYPVLVTYATRAGSTAETATYIADVLSKNNHPVDLRPVEEVTDISPYQSVILGSAIRIGKLLPEAMAFIETNQSLLQEKTFSIFLLCMTLENDNAENRATVETYLDPVRSLLKPAHIGLFPGVLNLSKLNIFDRLMITAMKTPVGDFRNWDEMNHWTQKIVL